MKTETMGKRVTRGVISAFLLIIFSVSLTLALLTLLGSSVLSCETFSDAVEQTGYVQGVREEIRGDFESLCVTTGIPPALAESFLEECVSDEDLLLPILQMDTDETLSHDTAAWNGEFCRRVEAYAVTLQEQGDLELTEEEWEQMKNSFPETANHFISKITGAVRLSGLFSVVGSAVRLVEKLTPYALAASIFLAFCSAVLLVLIQKKNSPLFAYIGFAASGILFLTPAFVLKNGNYAVRMSIEPSYLKGLLVDLNDRLLGGMTVVGTVLFAVAVAFGALNLVLALMKNKCKLEESKKMKGDEV